MTISLFFLSRFPVGSSARITSGEAAAALAIDVYKRQLLGDTVYGPAKCPFKGLQGQTLHARTLGIVHPRTGEYLEVEAPLPAYFVTLLERLRKNNL